jgi:superfamily II DNA/RNA helicase
MMHTNDTPSPSNELTRDDIAEKYLDELIYEPYPFQEEAILSWFDSEQGVMVCAPTGMGKTLIAEAALFEAIKTGKTAYYTTPLIALTEQKFRDLQETVVRWGYEPTDVGLVTGNRRENPDAKLLVVVAEILFNRLLHPEAFEFDDVSAVVMDEFHSFNDPERGIVWEFTLGLLPAHVRTLLLSATIGNAYEFVSWLRAKHNRQLELVSSDERKVPLTYEWVGDQFLNDHLTVMAEGDEETRMTPALVFCFNREGCWNVAEQIKGKKLIDSARQKELAEALSKFDWSQGVGPKLRQLLLRGVGVHHAGVLPRYRRIVEDLFQRKLLSVALCTETLAAGINLPARSVVLPVLLKGPPGKKKVIEPSSAHQIFGRAGRPQFDTRGHVFALAHEDDVRIMRWKEQYDQIPADSKDPKMLQMKKKLKRKMPKRRMTEQYWSSDQFAKLQVAPPADLAGKGGIPWRLLAYMLQASPEVKPIRELVGKRLMNQKHLEQGRRAMDEMIVTLWHAGYVELEPEPEEVERVMPVSYLGNEESVEHEHEHGSHPHGATGALPTYAQVHAEEERREEQKQHWGGLFDELDSDDPTAKMSGAAEATPTTPSEEPAMQANDATPASEDVEKLEEPEEDPTPELTFGAGLNLALPSSPPKKKVEVWVEASTKEDEPVEKPQFRPVLAHATPKMQQLVMLRSVNPLYGTFLLHQLGGADREERLQAFESVLELPGSVAYHVRPPSVHDLPPGRLAQSRLDNQLLTLGLATVEELTPKTFEEMEEERRNRFGTPEERVYVLNFAQKLRRLFDYDFPSVQGVRTNAVWVAGELLEFNGDFNKYVTSKKLQKQEGILFRHVLRLTLLLQEFAELTPACGDAKTWRQDLRDMARQLKDSCRRVDESSTDEILTDSEEEKAASGDSPILPGGLV